jgi:aarF domain-containing kinase
MLLILKTNDLMRGIEYTLKTNARMGAFRVMSQCCVKSVYNEKLVKENSKVGKFKVAVAQFWALFKIRLYYTVLSLKQLSLQILNS